MRLRISLVLVPGLAPGPRPPGPGLPVRLAGARGWWPPGRWIGAAQTGRARRDAPVHPVVPLRRRTGSRAQPRPSTRAPPCTARLRQDSGLRPGRGRDIDRTSCGRHRAKPAGPGRPRATVLPWSSVHQRLDDPIRMRRAAGHVDRASSDRLLDALDRRRVGSHRGDPAVGRTGPHADDLRSPSPRESARLQGKALPGLRPTTAYRHGRQRPSARLPRRAG